jgi:hypothetical protein
VYRSLFHLLFAPSPPVAASLQKEMNDAGLVSGAYAAAHLRTATQPSTQSEANPSRFGECH